MEEVRLEKKVLFISPAIQVLIPDVPKAKELLDLLTDNEGYEVKDIVEYATETAKEKDVIGHIVVGGVAYSIKNTEGLVTVLSKFVSPANDNAPPSPPVFRGFQQGGGDPNILRKSVEDSRDYEPNPDENSEIKLRGLEPEPESFSAKWCSWFSCCGRNSDQQPLLTHVSDPKLTK